MHHTNSSSLRRLKKKDPSDKRWYKDHNTIQIYTDSYNHSRLKQNPDRTLLFCTFQPKQIPDTVGDPQSFYQNRTSSQPHRYLQNWSSSASRNRWDNGVRAVNRRLEVSHRDDKGKEEKDAWACPYQRREAESLQGPSATRQMGKRLDWLSDFRGSSSALRLGGWKKGKDYGKVTCLFLNSWELFSRYTGPALSLGELGRRLGPPKRQGPQIHKLGKISPVKTPTRSTFENLRKWKNTPTRRHPKIFAAYTKSPTPFSSENPRKKTDFPCLSLASSLVSATLPLSRVFFPDRPTTPTFVKSVSSLYCLSLLCNFSDSDPFPVMCRFVRDFHCHM